jgi:hypothetical protein
MSATAKQDVEMLRYARQACVNLEQVFTALNDLEAVRHYQQRQRELNRKLSTPNSQPAAK